MMQKMIQRRTAKRVANQTYAMYGWMAADGSR